MSPPQSNVSDTDAPRTESPPEPTTVLVWRKSATPGIDLEALLQLWSDRGWQVRRREPRVLEGPDGPTHGVFLVLRREKSRPGPWGMAISVASTVESSPPPAPAGGPTGTVRPTGP